MKYSAIFPTDRDPLVRREAIEQKIERLLLLLDAFDGDADLEPSLGAPEVIMPLGWGQFTTATRQDHWSEGISDDREEEDEHGGDILDERHDPEEDSGVEDEPHDESEPTMRSPNGCHIAGGGSGI